LHKVLFLVLAASMQCSGQVTLRIPLERGQAEEVVVVTFDESRVSAADVKRWVLLHENGPYATSTRSYFAGCKSSNVPKMENDIKQMQEIVKKLDSTDYPSELSDVVAYFKRIQSFWLWQEEQELAFLTDGKAPDTEYNDVELGGCKVSDSGRQNCRKVLTTWHNCVLHLMQKRLGKYPTDKWKVFLDAYGIQERVESSLD
jgi:hypothetical protein